MEEGNTNQQDARKVEFLTKILFDENPSSRMFKAFGFLVFFFVLVVILLGSGWEYVAGLFGFIFLVRTIEYFIEWVKGRKNDTTR